MKYKIYYSRVVQRAQPVNVRTEKTIEAATVADAIDKFKLHISKTGRVGVKLKFIEVVIPPPPPPKPRPRITKPVTKNNKAKPSRRTYLTWVRMRELGIANHRNIDLSWREFKVFYRQVGQIPENFTLEKINENRKFNSDNIHLVEIGDHRKEGYVKPLKAKEAWERVEFKEIPPQAYESLDSWHSLMHKAFK